MTWILLTVLLVVAALVVVVAGQAGETTWAVRSRRGRSAGQRGAPRVQCLPCHGTGWRGGEPERTLTFIGDGFEDKHRPATLCPDCGGTGVAAGH
ncbi:hypothetical protein [Paractinoplanes maris]|uniref:hypothetical protein n=1 Tax=Paractinoplanes maris TaxID=1734446 RepID=UPI00202223F9|nr:hypothetical protein [Actinoplanes maris]